MKTTTRLSMLALAAVTALPLAAQQPPAGSPPAITPGAGPAAMLLRARAQLNLTEAQVARLQGLAESQRTALRPDRGAQLRLQADLADAMKGEGNLDAARRALTAMNAQRTDRALAMLKARQEARAVLTPEQRSKADALGAQLLQRRAAMRGGRGGGVGPGQRGIRGGRGGQFPGRGRGPDGFGPPGQWRRPGGWGQPGFPGTPGQGWRRPPEGEVGAGITPGTL